MNQNDHRYVKAAITGIVIVTVGLLVFFILYRIKEVQSLLRQTVHILKPFLYGGVLAYVLTPLARRLDDLFMRLFRYKANKLAKGLSIILSILMALALITTLTLIVLPRLVDSVVGIINALPRQIRAVNDSVSRLLQDRPDLNAQWNTYAAQLTAFIDNWQKNGLLPLAQSLLTGTANYVAGTLRFLKDFLLGLVICVYLLAIRKQLAAQCRVFIRSMFQDVWADRIEGEFRYADKLFNGFFLGRLLDSAIIGILCFIGSLFMGFSSPALISVIVGVTNIIPFFGPFIGAIPCILLLLLENPIHALMFLVFIIVLQQLDGNVIGPKILGNVTGLSGFWVTFAILFFGGMWGLVGMIVGIPLFAIIYDIVRRLCYRNLRRTGRAGYIDAYRQEFHKPLKK